MKKLFKAYNFFKIYKKNILKNETYLFNKYGLEINLWYELYTTIDLTDAPEDLIKNYGSALAEIEIKKYIKSIKNDSEKLELEELIDVYEIKKINNFNYGIAFGYKLMNNRTLIISKLITYTILLLTGITFLI